MITEMAAGFTIGLIPSGILSISHVLWARQSRKSLKFQNLRNNLAKIQMYWSENQACVMSVNEGEEIKDTQQFDKSVQILSLGCFLTSWLGFFFHILIWSSTAALAVSRFEKHIMNSKLTQTVLDKAEILDILQELSTQFPA